MIAPSERHLEDWIVQNPELFCEFGAYEFIGRVVARQTKLPNGRADLIALCDQTVVAVELKVGAIDEAVIGQTLRYVADLKNIWGQAYWLGAQQAPDDYTYCLTQHFGEVLCSPPEVGGIIIGHSLPKPSLRFAAFAAGISLVLYDFDGTAYQFEDVGAWRSEEDLAILKDYAYGAIGESMREAMRTRSALERDRKL